MTMFSAPTHGTPAAVRMRLDARVAALRAAVEVFVSNRTYGVRGEVLDIAAKYEAWLLRDVEDEQT